MLPSHAKLVAGIVCLAAAALLTHAQPARAADNVVRQKALELHKQYIADLKQLAAWCESKGLADEAKKTRRVVTPCDPYKLYVPALPEKIGPAKLPDDAPAAVVEWDAKLSELRRNYATAIFELSRRAVRGGQAAIAFELVLAAAQANPDFEPARRVLGYQKFRDAWHTPYEAKKLRAGFVWNEKFGWLPKAYVQRYEDGKCFSDGRWISAEDDARRHPDILSGWTLETEHYAIRTDGGIEAAAALGEKLEPLDRAWRLLFVRYYASAADVAAMFDGRAKPAAAAPAQRGVVYFRDRDEYNNSLRAVMPNIEISTGFYSNDTRRAYFFAGKDSDPRTMLHEATHQLFHESRTVAPDVGRQANFWVVEGIAMYMESLRREDGYYVLGGFDDSRLHAARYRRLHDDFYVPLDEFVDFGMERLQKDPRIATLYSQAAGLTHFLIHYDGGRYRDALVAYLSAVYSGRDDHNTLSKLTGASYGELDRQYREFLESGKEL